jgi:hypothetical protein
VVWTVPDLVCACGLPRRALHDPVHTRLSDRRGTPSISRPVRAILATARRRSLSIPNPPARVPRPQRVIGCAHRRTDSVSRHASMRCRPSRELRAGDSRTRARRPRRSRHVAVPQSVALDAVVRRYRGAHRPAAVSPAQRLPRRANAVIGPVRGDPVDPGAIRRRGAARRECLLRGRSPCNPMDQRCPWP